MDKIEHIFRASQNYINSNISDLGKPPIYVFKTYNDKLSAFSSFSSFIIDYNNMNVIGNDESLKVYFICNHCSWHTYTLASLHVLMFHNLFFKNLIIPKN